MHKTNCLSSISVDILTVATILQRSIPLKCEKKMKKKFCQTANFHNLNRVFKTLTLIILAS